METEYFFSGDWGTTSFRLRCVRVHDGRVVDEMRRDTGVKALFLEPRASTETDRESLFQAFLADACMDLAQRCGLHEAPVVFSGMVTSSIGWVELPYAPTPFPVDGSRAVLARRQIPVTASHRFPCYLVSGVRSESEMMRGEETELIGLFAQVPYQGLAQTGCMVLAPGTHSKHLLIHKGCLNAIHTYMTGELLDLLGKHSVLQATADWAYALDQGLHWSSETERRAFVDGVARAKDEGLSGSLFQGRTRGVLDGAPATENVWFLMGVCIGEECLRAIERCPHEWPFVLAAGSRLSPAYTEAFHALGVQDRLQVVPPASMDRMAIEGHRRLLPLLGAVEEAPIR